MKLMAYKYCHVSVIKAKLMAFLITALNVWRCSDGFDGVTGTVE